MVVSSTADIVVTGLGLIGAFGDNEESLASVLNGKRGCFGKCSWFETAHQVAEVRNFRLANYIKNPRAERSPRISQFTLTVATQALRQAGLDRASIESAAIVYGTGNGPAVSSQRSLDTIVGENLVAVEPLVFQESVFNAPASLVSIQFGIKGPVMVLPMGWTAGLCALKQGCDLLRRGTVEHVLVIAADELAGATHDALDRLGFVSPNNGGCEAIRPFDLQANGAIFGEGAAAMVLELAPKAAERGVAPRARISGCAIGGDAIDPDVSDPSSATMVRVMRRAMAQAGRQACDIDHVLAGTVATRKSDKAELNALGELFAKRMPPCPVTSIKSIIGEAVGPSGLFSIAAGLIEIETGRLFSNTNLEPPQLTGIELPLRPRQQQVRCILINALGVRGTYASVVLEALS